VSDQHAALSPAEHQDVLQRLILPAWTQGAAAQAGPVVVFVGGQPGAGKTQIADLVQAALDRRGRCVRVCRDLYKPVHRRYAELLAQDVRTAGVRLRPDTRAWQAEVEAHARARRLDTVVETALADADEFRATSRAYRQAGYRVEVLGMVTQVALSQLGLLDRFLIEDGRYVSWQNHDSCAKALPQTLAVIEAEFLADRVLLVRRGMEARYDNEVTDGAWRRPPGADRVFAAESGRWWSARETAWFRRQLADADHRLHHEQLDHDRRLAVHRDVERAAAFAEPVRRTAQPRPEPPGVDYHRLSAAEHRWIFDELIAPSYLNDITAHDHPMAVYVLGQPGAGKTQAARLVQCSLRVRRPTRIVGDTFKAQHPDYLRLLRETPRTAGERIRADYQAWQRQTEAYVRQRRGDVVIELAPDGAAQFLASAEPFQRAGYRVEVVVLAVRAADSRQGTAARYAEMTRAGLPARFTTAAGHDRCVPGLADAVRAAVQRALPVVIMRRDGSAVYRAEPPAEGRLADPEAAVGALVAEQHRPYTVPEGRRFLAVQQQLRAALPQYRDEVIAITRLAWPLLPAALQPRRLASPVRLTTQLLPAQRYAVPSNLLRRAA
jgi:Ni2+-binding GTPase involved in maturation of urease and hydrogenase